MNFKLDENFGSGLQELFGRKGHDCRTAREQHLGGATDEAILEAAVSEGRVLVTMDHDFGNVLMYPPARTCGIAIVNPPHRASRALLQLLLETLLAAVDQRAIRGKLWIVEPSRIREHETADPTAPEEDRQ